MIVVSSLLAQPPCHILKYSRCAPTLFDAFELCFDGYAPRHFYANCSCGLYITAPRCLRGHAVVDDAIQPTLYTLGCPVALLVRMVEPGT